MKMKLRYLPMTIMILTNYIYMPDKSYAQEPNQSLEWNIRSLKKAYYPGEPVLLNIDVMNKGSQKEVIHFGINGIDGFLMKIRDSNNIIVSQGEKIQKSGFTTKSPLLEVSQGEVSQKSIVLNQWCSTLLSPGQYTIDCNITYRLRSESKKKDNSEVYKAGSPHSKMMHLNFQIIEMDSHRFKEIIENLAAKEIALKDEDKKEWLKQRETAREMLAFTESELAIPYQLKILRVEQNTWIKEDIIKTLVQSGTLEAANGLIQIIEDPNVYKEDVKPILIDGIYKLREKGEPNIINATEGFVVKYKRPVLTKPMD